MLAELRIRALIVGTVVYIASVVVTTLMLTVVANWNEGIFQTQIFRVIFWIAGVAMLATGGFVAGWVAKERGLLHGFVVGLVGGIIVGGILQWFLPTSEEISTTPIFGYVATSLLLTTLGGGIGELYSPRTR